MCVNWMGNLLLGALVMWKLWNCDSFCLCLIKILIFMLYVEVNKIF